MLIELIEREIE